MKGPSAPTCLALAATLLAVGACGSRTADDTPASEGAADASVRQVAINASVVDWVTGEPVAGVEVCVYPDMQSCVTTKTDSPSRLSVPAESEVALSIDGSGVGYDRMLTTHTSGDRNASLGFRLADTATLRSFAEVSGVAADATQGRLLMQSGLIVDTEQLEVERRAMETYIAVRFGPMISDENTWANPANPVMAEILADGREMAERAVANNPDATEADLDALRRDHPDLMKRIEATGQDFWSRLSPPDNLPTTATGWLGAMFGIVVGLLRTVGVFYAVAGLLTAALFRVGFTLRALQLTIVTGSGDPAPRWRTVLRSAVAWSPIGLLFVPLWPTVLSATSVALLLTGIVWAIANPSRGLQDRVAGTWLVPS